MRGGETAQWNAEWAGRERSSSSSSSERKGGSLSCRCAPLRSLAVCIHINSTAARLHTSRDVRRGMSCADRREAGHCGKGGNRSQHSDLTRSNGSASGSYSRESQCSCRRAGPWAGFVESLEEAARGRLAAQSQSKRRSTQSSEGVSKAERRTQGAKACR